MKKTKNDDARADEKEIPVEISALRIQHSVLPGGTSHPSIEMVAQQQNRNKKNASD